jgi:hypothetical protein
MGAAAGLTYLFGDKESVEVGELRLLASTTTTVTLGWDPVPGAVGYRFSSEVLGGKYAFTWDPEFQHTSKYPPCNTTFSKGAWYKVEALSVKKSLSLA